jgi:hypothetical protein
MKLSFRSAALTIMSTLPLPAIAAPIHAILYKNPTCNCCDDYAGYLRQSGFEVDIKLTDELTRISSKAGVPAALEGCHTMFIDRYVFDGLIPIDIVEKVLRERPDIAGIALPGMPVGAPGMNGDKSEPLTVYAFVKDGKPPAVYAVE